MKGIPVNKKAVKELYADTEISLSSEFGSPPQFLSADIGRLYLLHTEIKD